MTEDVWIGSQRTDDAVERLRTLAARGLATEDLMEHLVSCLGRELSPLSFMAVLRRAFRIPLTVLRDAAEGWVGCGRVGCDTSTEVVAEALNPYVEEFRAAGG
jgi:hypothetical protein